MMLFMVSKIIPHIQSLIFDYLVTECELAIEYDLTSLKTLKSYSLEPDSGLPKKIVICFIESPLKMIKNAFYFILKALFVLKMFKFLS